MKAEDYKSFCRGEQVMVQLKGNMCMGVEGDDGIELAQSGTSPRAWEAEVAAALEKETGKSPTAEEVQATVAQNPLPPPRPVMMPILIGTLEWREGSELLIGHYDYTEDGPDGPRKIAMEVTIDPNDIKHVSHLVGGKIVT